MDRSLLILSWDLSRCCKGLYISFSSLGRVELWLSVVRPSCDLTRRSLISLTLPGGLEMTKASLSSREPDDGAIGEAVSSFLMEGS